MRWTSAGPSQLPKPKRSNVKKTLESPAAAQEREASRTAFSDLAAAEAKVLLETTFVEQLRILDSDPARFLSDAEILKPTAPTVAAVREEGDKTLLDAGIPVRIENDAGDLRKVDLSLLAAGNGYQPVNPITDVTIPDNAAGAIRFGDAGIQISSVGGDGDRSGQRLEGENIFYPEALGPDTDADLLIAPIAAGVEIFNQIRSPNAPEVLRFRFDLPAGAALRSDGNGGAEVVRGDERLASIPYPYAVDAQGSSFPVELQVEGQILALRVAHREADIAYPLLVDPVITEDFYNYNWFNGHNLEALTNGAWQYTESHAWIEASTYCIYACWGVGRGLFVSMPSGTHWGQQYGHWSYSRPNENTFLANAWASPFVRNDHGCSRSAYPQPHDYVGMWLNGKWNRFLNDMAIAYGSADIQSWGSDFIVGLSTGGGSGSFPMPCWRDLALGGAAIWLDDWERPTLSTSSQDTWIDSNPIRLNVSATDPGLGVKSFKATGTTSSGASETWWTEHPCFGVYGSPCPATWNLGDPSQPMLNFNPAALPEGIRKLQVEAFDVTEKPSHTMSEMTVRVDHAAPAITLSGTVTEQATLGTERPRYTFRAEAKDGVPDSENPDDVRSGATGLVFKNDGHVVSEYSPGCATQSCSVSREIEVPARDLTPGQHTLSVIATDAFGHASPPKTLTYTTGDKQLPTLTSSGWPEESSALPTYSQYWTSFGILGSADGQLKAPADVAIDADGNLWVADKGNNRIQKFGPDGEFLMKFGSAGTGNGQFNSPASIAIDAGGNLWVADKGNGRVQKFNEKGEYLGQFGSKGSGNGQFAVGGPEGLAIDPKGNIWVTDTYAGRIQKFDSSGNFLKVVGSKGTAPGQLGEPTGIDIAPNGSVWVSDSQHNRVAVFSEAGEFVTQFGSVGTGNGQFNRPDAIAIGNRGEVWVGDQNNARIQEFDQSGKYLAQFGSKGSGSGQFDFTYPLGLATDSKGSIWVADTNNNRVQRWLAPTIAVPGFLEPVTGSATDSGFGITDLSLKLTSKGQEVEVLDQRTQSCPDGGCSLSAEFGEIDLSDRPSGAYILSLTATDAGGNRRTHSRVINLDSSPPELELSGLLAERHGLPLNASSGELQIDASDLGPATAGVRAINVERDGEEVASYSFDCAASDCHEVDASYSYVAEQDGAARSLQPVSSAGSGSIGRLRRVSCGSVTDCWAIGRTEYPVTEMEEGKVSVQQLQRWNGSEWQTTTVPKPVDATSVTLEGISCASTSACTIAGYYHDGTQNRPMAAFWDGGSWTTAAAALPSGATRGYLHGISCVAPNACWAYGKTHVTFAEQMEGKAPTPFLERWNGSEWQTTTVPKPPGATSVTLEGISCASTNACTIAGYYHDGTQNRPMAAFWDGASWSAAPAALPSGATKGYLHGVSCVAANACWAYGKTQVTLAEQTQGKVSTPFLESWNGSEWQTATVPKPPGATSVTLEGISCASTNACTAVGRYTRATETFPLLFTWGGSEWRLQPARTSVEATNSALEGVDCIEANQCAMVGYWRPETGKWNVLAERETPASGPHTLTVEAVDTMGNTVARSIEVDVPTPSFDTPKCETDATTVPAKGVVSATEAVDVMEESTPATVAASQETTQETTEVEVDPSYSAPQPSLQSEDSLVESEASVTSEEGFALSNLACVVPEQTTAAATEAKVVNGDAAVFANTAPETDTVIRPTAAGTTVFQSLRGPESPDSFSWTIEVSPGQELVELPSGAVAIVQDPPQGEPIEETSEPAAKEPQSEAVLNDAQLQLEQAEQELVRAQGETTQEVVAVIPLPWVVLSDETIVPAKIEVTPDVQVPVIWELEVTIPQAVIEADTWPAGLAVSFMSSYSANGQCLKANSPCGSFDLERAAKYAKYWGDEDNEDARNPRYWDYGSNDCTNFLSQIARAGGMKYMRYGTKGDGSWWVYRTLTTGAPIYDDTESWRLADKFPRHIWRFGLAHIDPVQQPWGWTRGGIVAMDWLGEDERGDINHLMFVVGTRQGSEGREPLLANHSTVSYPRKPWPKVRDRIEDQHDSNWTRFAMAFKYTEANLYAKKHAPENLYNEDGLFDG